MDMGSCAPPGSHRHRSLTRISTRGHLPVLCQVTPAPVFSEPCRRPLICVAANATPRLTQPMSARSVFRASGPTYTNPFIGLPGRSIGRAPGCVGAASPSSGARRTMRSSPVTPTAMLPRAVKHGPPSILISVTPRTPPNAARMRETRSHRRPSASPRSDDRSRVRPPSLRKSRSASVGAMSAACSNAASASRCRPSRARRSALVAWNE